MSAYVEPVLNIRCTVINDIRNVESIWDHVFSTELSIDTLLLICS